METTGLIMTVEGRIVRYLEFLYGEEDTPRLWETLKQRLATFREENPQLPDSRPSGAGQLTERDVVLITYGDQFAQPGHTPLHTLSDFLSTHLVDAISHVHILPFFPYSSDDGFSIIDYRLVNPAMGSWEDVERIGHTFQLMFDAVINHISQHGLWFEEYRRQNAPYTGYFIAVDDDVDLSSVVRPRDLPLLTPVETSAGVKKVWTTFSADQIDLNYADPLVALEIIDILLFYVARGAEIIRLDAIAYLWKEIGTSCIHLPQTHAMVKLWRATLDAVAPWVLLITETNVPHADNVSYFGNYLPETGNTDEAQLVYNFTLGPLVLHTFHTGSVARLNDWAAALRTPSAGAAFFNFIASHDGIGVMPARGILSEDEIQNLVDRTLAHGGKVSHGVNPDGTRSVYELNITLYDFLNAPESPENELAIKQFLASQAILLSLAGVPGIYIHSLFGSHNCYACAEKTGRARSLNREKFDYEMILERLADPHHYQYRLFHAHRQMLELRRNHAAFHPAGPQVILPLHDSVFAIVRRAPESDAVVLCLINVSAVPRRIRLGLAAHGLPPAAGWKNLLDGHVYDSREGELSLTLSGYDVLWLDMELAKAG